MEIEAIVSTLAYFDRAQTLAGRNFLKIRPARSKKVKLAGITRGQTYKSVIGLLWGCFFRAAAHSRHYNFVCQKHKTLAATKQLAPGNYLC
jgi:hypothetical protein